MRDRSTLRQVTPFHSIQIISSKIIRCHRNIEIGVKTSFTNSLNCILLSYDEFSDKKKIIKKDSKVHDVSDYGRTAFPLRMTEKLDKIYK